MVLDFGILLVIFSLGPTQKKKLGRRNMTPNFVYFAVQIF